MRTIAIILGDNDFGCTMFPLMETVNRVILWHGIESKEITESFIIRIIMEGLKFHYVAFQKSHEDKLNLEDLQKTTVYLNSMVRILFDDEAEEDIAKKSHNHGAWYLEIQTGKVYSY